MVYYKDADICFSCCVMWFFWYAIWTVLESKIGFVKVSD